MRRNQDVIKQVIRVSFLNLGLAAAELLVYALLGRFTGRILISVLVGLLISCGSFLALSVVVSRAADMAEGGGDPHKAAGLVRASSTGRLLVILIIYVVLFRADALDPIASLMPLVFTRVSVMLADFFRKEGDT